MEYICIQSSLSNHRGLVPGPLKYTKSQVALVPYIKWRSICILPIFAYRLQQGMPTHHFIAGIQCSIQCMASSSFAFWKFLWFFFFRKNVFSVVGCILRCKIHGYVGLYRLAYINKYIHLCIYVCILSLNNYHVLSCHYLLFFCFWLYSSLETLPLKDNLTIYICSYICKII